MEKKLIEVAKEFNVSKDSIADFLTSKGYQIDNRPIAKVTDPMYVELTKKFQDSLSEKKKAEQISIGERDRHRHHHQNNGQHLPKKDLSHLPPKKESLLVTQMPTKNAEANPTNQNGSVVAPPVAPIALPTPPVSVEEKKVAIPPVVPNGSDKEKDRKIPDLRQLPGLRVIGKIDLTPRKKEVPPPPPPAPKKEERNERNDRNDRPNDRPNDRQDRPNDRSNENGDRNNDRRNDNYNRGDRNDRNDRDRDRNRNRDRDNRNGDNRNRPEVKAETPPVALPPVKVEPVVPEKVVEERIEPELVRADIPQLKGLQIKGKIDLTQISPSENRERNGRRRDRRDRDRRGGQGQGMNQGIGQGTNQGTGTNQGQNTTGGQNNPSVNGENRNQVGGDRNQVGGDRNQVGGDRNQVGGDRNQGGDRRDRDRNRDRNRNNDNRPPNQPQTGTDADKDKVIIIPQMTTAQQTGQPSEEARKRRRKRRKVSADGVNIQGQGGENRNQGQGGDNRNIQGGGENRNQGGGENRNQGSGENRNQGSGENRNQGQGGDNRNQGQGTNNNNSQNRGIGGQGTNNNNSQNRGQGGGNYQNRQGGGGDNRNQGQGTNNTNNNSSQNRTQGGGQGGNNQQGGGGYQNRNAQGGGGYQNRPSNNTGTGTNHNSGTNNNNNRGGTGGANFPPRRDDAPKEITQKHIDDKIKETMARLSVVSKNKGQKIRRDKREIRREREQQRRDDKEIEKLQVAEFISVADLASLMNVSAPQVITTCMGLGIMVSINQRLEADVIEIVAAEFGHEVEFVSAEEQITDALVEEVDDPADLEDRAPVVTVMGHVDHGKTSLLDYIRSAKVAQGEAGGITQHIGAYEVVTKDDKKITFLDTPGHEAFTAMRARGAKVTDVAVIIISADDDIMPQTKEAISHAQAAGVPMVFAINKIDKPGANPENIKRRLSEMNILVEDWGGKFQSQDISAKKGTNVDSLLEKILLEAEILDLKANPNRAAIGTVIEASLDKGRGYVTKMLVQRGTLKIGDAMVAGEHSGKVKAMFNERGKRLKTAGPSTPVLVLGLSGAPQAGEKFKILPSESDAREIATKRAQIIREQSTRSAKRISLDEIGRRLALGNFKELNLIVKGDFDGSVEALSDSLLKQSQTTVQVKVIHKAVGPITESDVLLASASDAIIVGFQVRPSPMARKLAERDGVEIKMYSIIYEAIDEIRSAIEGMLEPTKEEKMMGQVEVREIFKISKVGTIAGAYVTEGKIMRNSLIRVIRQGIVVFPMKEGAIGQLASLKRYKDDMKEVKFGFECGLMIDNYNDIQIGDVIEAYEIIEVKQKMM